MDPLISFLAGASLIASIHFARVGSLGGAVFAGGVFVVLGVRMLVDMEG